MKKILLLWLFPFTLNAQNFDISVDKKEVGVYDFVEITATFKKADATLNPFKSVKVEAAFSLNNAPVKTVEGFCDSPNGRLFKVRFMPEKEGNYTFEINIEVKGKKQKQTGRFTAIPSKRKGILRLDKENPWHFKYENGERYFWNSTTAYWMLGLKDEKTIQQAIDRLANLGINRIRVAINGRAHGGDR